MTAFTLTPVYYYTSAPMVYHVRPECPEIRKPVKSATGAAAIRVMSERWPCSRCAS